jgi:hypothetical protein
MTSVYIQAFVSFVRRAITKEDTLLETKFKFPNIVRSKMRPTCTTKGFKPGIVRFCMKELLKGRGKIDDMKGKMIYKVRSNGEGFISKFERHACMRK